VTQSAGGDETGGGEAAADDGGGNGDADVAAGDDGAVRASGEEPLPAVRTTPNTAATITTRAPPIHHRHFSTAVRIIIGAQVTG
jgi:hypothetical protein